MPLIALVCSLPVALVGAYYLVNAGAVAWMGGFEGDQANRVRMRLRRSNGVIMLLMSLALYLGISRAFGRDPGAAISPVAPVAWLATMPLLLAMLLLAWLDMRLTRKLKRDLLRKAAMTSSNPSAANSHNTALKCLPPILLAMAMLGSGAAIGGCDETSAQPPGDRQASKAPATAPATKPTTTRTQDGPRPQDGQPQQLRTVEMQLGTETFVIQVADTDEERMYGLMFCKELPTNEGMIFIYPDDDWRSFWMKNTFIPLDIAFVNERGLVVNVAQMAPHDLEGTASTAPAKYAIELPLNAARRIGLEAGMTLKIPANAKDAKD